MYDWANEWKKYQVHDLPKGESGNWRVEKFSVSDEEAKHANAMSAFSFGSRAYYVAGEFTRLMRGQAVIMSDTRDEVRDHLSPIRAAKGQCLIGGLGIGVVTNGCLLKPEVEHVTVIELSEDVIKLVSDHYKKKFGDRLTIIHDNVMTWKPPRGMRYDMAWFDIWDNICTDNCKDMGTLNRRYARCTSWKGSWKEDDCKYWLRQEKRSSFL